MELLKRLETRSAGLKKKIILPETADERVMEAVNSILDNKSSRLVLIGEKGELNRKGYETDNDLVEIRCWEEEENRQPFIRVVQRQAKEPLPAARAEEMLGDPLIYAGVLLVLKHADAAVAGSISTTAEVIRAGLKTVGVDPESELVSSIFLMTLKEGRTITFSDCGVVPSPDPGQLAAISIDAGKTHLALTGETPRIAFLSFSTKGSSDHEKARQVSKAVETAQQLNSGWLIDGELQFDAAFLPDVAEKKAPESPLKGEANIFIFPNLDAGNIAYKITERLAGATATGPILQGFSKPYLDLSRGCSSRDIVHAVHAAAILAE